MPEILKSMRESLTVHKITSQPVQKMASSCANNLDINIFILNPLQKSTMIIVTLIWLSGKIIMYADFGLTFFMGFSDTQITEHCAIVVKYC